MARPRHSTLPQTPPEMSESVSISCRPGPVDRDSPGPTNDARDSSSMKLTRKCPSHHDMAAHGHRDWHGHVPAVLRLALAAPRHRDRDQPGLGDACRPSHWQELEQDVQLEHSTPGQQTAPNLAELFWQRTTGSREGGLIGLSKYSPLQQPSSFHDSERTYLILKILQTWAPGQAMFIGLPESSILDFPPKHGPISCTPVGPVRFRTVFVSKLSKVARRKISEAINTETLRPNTHKVWQILHSKHTIPPQNHAVMYFRRILIVHRLLES